MDASQQLLTEKLNHQELIEAYQKISQELQNAVDAGIPLWMGGYDEHRT